MNLILDDLVQILITGLIPFLRISALLLAAPLVSLRVVSVRIRIALALLLTIFIYPMLDLPAIDATSAYGIRLITQELFIGILFAIVLQVVNAAMVLAGQSMSMSMGLGMAQTIDPNAGQVPVLASFLVVLSTLIFLSVGGHLIMIKLILQSFEVLPIGGAINVKETLGNVIEWTAMAFLGAVLVALPIMLTMMLINLCIGIVTRAAPALNIFAVGFPAMVLTGMILIVVYMVNIGHRIEWIWLEAFDTAQSMWVVP
ncbi:MAG: flagellar biosynthetic protein FliR [Proteobacteria bacterium]|jgi:flagellar biosynthetic protein FliR|nr:flagellar biosynthetic protein FliR [Pseudomonadota bacterium]